MLLYWNYPYLGLPTPQGGVCCYTYLEDIVVKRSSTKVACCGAIEWHVGILGQPWARQAPEATNGV